MEDLDAGDGLHGLPINGADDSGQPKHETDSEEPGVKHMSVTTTLLEMQPTEAPGLMMFNHVNWLEVT